jgi:hypothetical protein
LTIDNEIVSEEIIPETEKEPSLIPKPASQRLNESPSVTTKNVQDDYTVLSSSVDSI